MVWFFAALWLGVSGVARGGAGKPPLMLAAAVTLPLLVFAADARFGWRLFRGLAQLSLPALIAMQTYRIGGVFFVIAWMNGELPAGFALPAGLGDIAIGAAAPFVAAAVADGRPRARALALAWSVLGLVDLVAALSLGVTHSSSLLGVFATSVTTRFARGLSVQPDPDVRRAAVVHAARPRVAAPPAPLTRVDRRCTASPSAAGLYQRRVLRACSR